LKKNTYINLISLIGIGLLIYTTLRAYHIGLTCDEASTYLSHTSRNLWTCFFSDACWSDANNHWLNTFLMQKSIAMFGVSELSLRLPNLLGHLLYLVASFFLVKKNSTNFWIALAGFCILNFNPFLLEFFALARGYGLGIGCMMVSITFFFSYLKHLPTERSSKKAMWLIGSFVMAILTVLSNFIFLNYFTALIGIFLLDAAYDFYYYKKKKLNFTLLSIPILTCLFLFFILKKPIQILLAQGYLYPYTSVFFIVVSLSFLIISITVGIFSFYKNKKNQKDNFSKIYFASVLLLIIFLTELIVQYYWLGVQYLVDRKAVVLIPLVSLPVYFLLEKINNKRLNSISSSQTLEGKRHAHTRNSSPFKGLILPILFSIFFINHFERTSNLEKSMEWNYDSHTKQMMQYIQDKHSDEEKIKLGVFWIFGPASEFYQQQFSLDLSAEKAGNKIKLQRLEDNELSVIEKFDFIYIQKSQEGILSKKYQVEKRFGNSGILYRNFKNE